MENDHLLTRAYRLINLYNAAQKKPRTYPDGLVLYPAQTHMIEIIGADEGITQSEIAARYMITKGAVSQIISFLEGKELIVRRPSPKGRRSTGLYLSGRGREVLEAHRGLHREMTDQVAALAAELDADAAGILERIADVIEQSIRELHQKTE